MTSERTPGTRGSERLQKALDLYLSGMDRESLVREHPDLAELIEPMFAADAEQTRGGEDRGRVIGGFQVLRELGRGGMGVVHEAFQPSLSRKVALKVLPALATGDPQAVNRFRREAATCAALEHPGIVKIFEFGHSDLEYWIAMELVPGGTLSERADDLRARGIPTCVATIAAVADALQIAHDRGLVHRDVKPGNILLRADLSPVLTDFGLARDLLSPAASQTGGFVGTPYYASPEHVSARLVDARSDVFSLGATLYVLLTGEKPFPGDTTDEVLLRIRQDPPRDPARLRKGIPDDLCAIVLKALEKDPAARYQTAADFARDLRAFLAFEPVNARRPGPVKRAVRWMARRPLLTTLGVTLVALLGIGGYLLANLDDLRAGGRLAVEAKVEQVLLLALRDRQSNQPQDSIPRVEALLTELPDQEELIGSLVFMKWHDVASPRDPAAQRELLAYLREHASAVGKSRSLRRLEARLLVESGAKDEGAKLLAELGDPKHALEYWVEGKVLALLRDPGSLASDREMLDRFRGALLASTRPRIVLAFEYGNAVRIAGDRATAEDAATYLGSHWPDDALAWTWTAIVIGPFDPPGAVRAARKAVQIDPNLALAWQQLGLALLRENEHPEGEAALLRAAEIDGDSWTGHATRAHRHLVRGEFVEGLAAAERSLALNPKARDARVLCAFAKMHLGALQAAEAILAPMWKQRPSDMELGHAIGSLMVKQSRFDEAIPILRRVVALRRWNEIAWFDLGTALAMKKQYPEARAALERSVELDPPHAQAHLNLGRVLLDLGELDNAEAESRRATELDPRLAEGWTNLLAILQKRGDKAAIERHFDAWSVARPKDGTPYVLRAHEMLKKQPFDPNADGDRVLEIARRGLQLDPSVRLTALGIDVDVLIGRQQWAEALKKLDEVKVAARESGWTPEQVKKGFDGLEVRLRREGRRAQQSRPSTDSRPESGR